MVWRAVARFIVAGCARARFESNRWPPSEGGERAEVRAYGARAMFAVRLATQPRQTGCVPTHNAHKRSNFC